MAEKKPESLTDNLSTTRNYQPSKGDDETKKVDFDKLKGKLEDFKKKIVKKFPFTISLGVLPANASAMFEEDEGVSKEEAQKKLIHILMIIPEDKYKELGKIKQEIIKIVKESGENFWIHIKSAEVDMWNYGLDSKFEFLDATSACFPLHDNGFLGALRVANIHKSLVLNWLNVGRVRYIATYGIFGSLVRGTADKTSDVDVTVIIDDTDVKRMSRIELLEKLRGRIVYDFVKEATALAGVKNILNVQVWLLTDFWERVKDAEPIAFTFIRDGIPLYDRGTFIPWKRLLTSGRIRPSPEAIEKYMKESDRTNEMVKRRLMDAMIDIYYGVVTPTQAMMMLAGQAPPVPKTMVEEVKKILVEKEKVMSQKELKTLEKVVKMFKDYEHGKLKEVSGKEIDELLEESVQYAKRMNDVREKLEKVMQENQAEKIHGEVFDLIKKIFGNKSRETLIKDLENEMIKKGKMPGRMLDIAKDISKLNAKVKGKKLSQGEMHRISGNAAELMAYLTEYSQRKELVSMEKGIMQLTVKGKKVEVIATDSGFFVVDQEGNISVVGKNKLEKSDKAEFDEALKETKDRLRFGMPSEVIGILRKEYGQFEISF